jgi:putative membrane protein
VTNGSDGDVVRPVRNAAADRRRPRSVYGVGTEPDPRFSMANERTALAWVRTGLAFIAGGIALTSVAAVTNLPKFLDIVAVLSCLVGGVTAVNSLVSWRRIERAMRQGEPLPAPTALRWLVGAVVIAAAIIVGYAIAQV